MHHIPWGGGYSLKILLGMSRQAAENHTLEQGKVGQNMDPFIGQNKNKYTVIVALFNKTILFVP